MANKFPGRVNLRETKLAALSKVRLQWGRRPLERVRVRSRSLVDELHPLGEGGDLGLQGADPLPAGLSGVSNEKTYYGGQICYPYSFLRQRLKSHSIEYKTS